VDYLTEDVEGAKELQLDLPETRSVRYESSF